MRRRLPGKFACASCDAHAITSPDLAQPLQFRVKITWPVSCYLNGRRCCMLTQQQLRHGIVARGICSVALGTALLASPVIVFAQDQEHVSFVADVAKHVVLDPTTYAPAIIAYDSTMRDWNSSQPFFQNGYAEHNPFFTVSGLPNDRAVSYTVGKQMIVRDLFTNLEVSAVNN